MGNVGYLLDTCTFLWAIRGSSNLSDDARKIIENVDIPLYISAVSAYEIMNKFRLGKLNDFEDVVNNYFQYVDTLIVNRLPINEHHTHFAGIFKWSHRDPFDRLLASQALIENLTLLTNDPVFNTIPDIDVSW